MGGLNLTGERVHQLLNDVAAGRAYRTYWYGYPDDGPGIRGRAEDWIRRDDGAESTNDLAVLEAAGLIVVDGPNFQLAAAHPLQRKPRVRRWSTTVWGRRRAERAARS